MSVPLNRSWTEPEDLPIVVSVEEAAAFLRIGRTCAYELARRYEATGGREGLPVVRLGRLLRVPRQGLLSALGTDRRGRFRGVFADGGPTPAEFGPAAQDLICRIPGRGGQPIWSDDLVLCRRLAPLPCPLITCQAGGTLNIDTAADQKEREMADSPEDVIVEFEKAALANDFAAMADLYEQDATLVMATMEVLAQGRDAIRATWESMSAMGQFVAMDIESRPIVQDGDLAVAHLVASVRLQSPDSDEATVIPVRATEVMRRGADGKWRYLIDHS